MLWAGRIRSSFWDEGSDHFLEVNGPSVRRCYNESLVSFGKTGMGQDVTHGVLKTFGLQYDGGTSALFIVHRFTQPVFTRERLRYFTV